ncbi:cytoskeletal protein [Lithospermum erythrorhizon]|uniref:Cytoskeletal protein n=1 Tax=Lithospermum erythrorhizon TaxID=34254 RepID=A0AAV3P209_LITER
MTRLSRSKSYSTSQFNSSSPLHFTQDSTQFESNQSQSEDDEEDDNVAAAFMKTPEVGRRQKAESRRRRFNNNNNNNENPLISVMVETLRKSLLVTCSVERGDDVDASLDIGWPTEVHHVAHVTFDRSNGSFLGLPIELQPEVPIGVPSASASVFGVSAQSMQCSFDSRGNSVPTILIRMQHRLYSEGGLQMEGIFRITGDNGQEKDIRNQMNTGIVPHGIDVHCIAGLIKAWFRELPTGVLDSLTPEQVMHCNTEEECVRLVDLLPPTEASLLDWAINLMADVVQHESQNKMNARNIAMVFAPNMTQMADPLTALIHAVQVMNFLKTLIHRTLREREPANTGPLVSTCPDP